MTSSSVSAPVVVTQFVAAPALTLTKVADDATNRAIGDIITYIYTVDNTGDVVINDVTVSDVHSGSGPLSAISIDVLTNTSGNSSDDGADGDIDVLAPGDLATFEATYEVTVADAIAGTDITNTATATGTPTSGTLVDPTASESVSVEVFSDVGRPANPTGVCNWNWNYWNSGGPDDNPTGGNRRLDPSLRIFTQDDDWYATDITPNAAHSLADNVAPPQITGTNSEWERAYGVGYFVAPPGSTQTIDLTDAGAFEGHALAFFDSSGTQFGRFPAANGSYIASTNNAAHVDANGIQVPPSSTGTTTFTVPADGQYYIHYIWADEDNLGNFYTCLLYTSPSPRD